MYNYPYLLDKTFLQKFNKEKCKQQHLKVNILNWKEEPIQQVSGLVLNGNINMDASSAMRRTGNITFFASQETSDITNIDNLFSINKKIEIEIGYSNTTEQYTEYPIIWFPQGIFLIKDASISHGLDGLKVSLTLHDKMALLNGECGGTLPAATIFHEMEQVDSYGNVTISKPTIVQIIQELVHHFGGEQAGKIIIKDLQPIIKQVLKWNGTDDRNLYVYNKKASSLLYDVLKEEPNVKDLLNKYKQINNLKNNLEQIDEIEITSKKQREILKQWEESLIELKNKLESLNFSTIDDVEEIINELYNLIRDTKIFCNDNLVPSQPLYTQELQNLPCFNSFGMVDKVLNYTKNLKTSYSRIKNLISSKFIESSETPYWEKGSWQDSEKGTLSIQLPINEPVLLQTIFALPDANYNMDFYKSNFAQNYNCIQKDDILTYELPYYNIKISQSKFKKDLLTYKTARETAFFHTKDQINYYISALKLNKASWNVRTLSLVILQNGDIFYNKGKASSLTYRFPFADFLKIRRLLLNQNHHLNLKEPYKSQIIKIEKRICDTLSTMLTGITLKEIEHYEYTPNNKGDYIFDKNTNQYDHVSFEQKEWAIKEIKPTIISQFIGEQELQTTYQVYEKNKEKPTYTFSKINDAIRKKESLEQEYKEENKRRYSVKKTNKQCFLKNYDGLDNLLDDNSQHIPIYNYPYAKKTDFLKLIDDFLLWVDTIINYLQLLKNYENNFILRTKSIKDIFLSNNIISKQQIETFIINKNQQYKNIYSLETSYFNFIKNQIQQLEKTVDNLPQQILKYNNEDMIVHLRNNYKNLFQKQNFSSITFKNIDTAILNSFKDLDFAYHFIVSSDKIKEPIIKIMTDFLEEAPIQKTIKGQLTGELNNILNIIDKNIKNYIDLDKDNYSKVFKQMKVCQLNLNNQIAKLSNQIEDIHKFQQSYIKKLASTFNNYYLNTNFGHADFEFKGLSELINLTKENEYYPSLNINIDNNLFLNKNNNKIFSSLNKKTSDIENILSKLNSIVQIDLVEIQNLNFSSLKDCLDYYKKAFTNMMYQIDNHLLEEIKNNYKTIFNNIQIFKPGQDIGYTLTKFIYPGQLTAEAGQTVVSVLDKIKNTLGNFEYFYDVNGNFIFQEIKNYLNKSYSSYVLTQNTSPNYNFNIADGKSVYNFENNEIIQSYSSNPQFSAIKNNFIVWGERKSPDGKKYPIRYHLAIDNKPEIKSKYKFQKLPKDLDANINYHYKSDFPKEGEQFKYYYAHYENKFYKWMIEKNSTFFGYQEAVPPSSDDTLFFSSQKDMQKFLKKKKNDLISQIKNIKTLKELTHEYYVTKIFSLNNGFQQKKASIENGKSVAILLKHIFIQNENKYYKAKFSIPLYNDLSNNIQDNVSWQLIQTFSTFFGNIIITNDDNDNDNNEKIFKSNDYRMELFLNGIINSNLNNDTSEYYTELVTEWPKLYNIFPQNKEQPDFYEDVKKNPTNIDYFLDILSDSNLVTKYGIPNIGKRTVVIKNNNINCIFEPVCPDIIYIDKNPQINTNQSIEDQERQKEKIQRQKDELKHNINIWNNKNYFSSFDTIIETEHEVYKQIVNGGAARSAYEEIRTALYQYITYNEQLSLTTLPVYNLQPNQIITVNNEQAHISGDFLIKNISFSLGSDSIMNLSCSKVIQRI